MALTTCKACGGPISTAAKACPRCGQPVPKKTSIATWVVGAVFAVVIISAISRKSEVVEQHDARTSAEAARFAALTPEQQRGEQMMKEVAEKNAAIDERVFGARYSCREWVKASLHDPGSATFADTSTFVANEEKLGVYDVQVTLRARNGFNALRAMTVDCRTRFDGKDWQLVGLKER